jgi:adenine deaminase
MNGGTIMARKDLIDVAMGKMPATLIIQGGRLVNVYTKEIYPADVAIYGDRIAAVGDVKYTKGKRTKTINAEGKYLTPGLIETHLHSYHSYLNLTAFAKACLIHGTTAVVDGFYGPGIVCGAKAIRFLIDELKRTPLKLIFLVPINAYLQNRELGLPGAPESPTLEELRDMLDWDECKGLEEPPLSLLLNDPFFLDLFQATLDQGKVISGHACGIDKKSLDAYLATGAVTDHEVVETQEALMKVRAGMKVLMRQGSGATDVEAVSRGITEHGIDSRSFAFCADLASPEKLVGEGDIDECIRVAIASGIDPITAVQMATINAAEIFRVDNEIGSIGPGKIADILLVDDLPKFQVSMVIADGRIVVDNGRFLPVLKSPKYPEYMYNTVKLEKQLMPEDFEVLDSSGKKEVRVRVITATEGSLITEERIEVLKVVGGVVQPDLERDIAKISMVDRFLSSKRVGNGFVQGFRLKRGAFGTTANAVCENIVVAGTNSQDMAIAANKMAEMGGGKVAVIDGAVKGQMEMALCGLLAEGSLTEIMAKFSTVLGAIKEMECELKAPFSTLEFSCACTDIGFLKICDLGLLNVPQREIVDVIVN